MVRVLATLLTRSPYVSTEYITDTSAIPKDIGVALYHKGDYDGALEQLRKALAIRESKLGANHPDAVACVDDIQFILATKQR